MGKLNRQLNQGQIDMLSQLYKFRFGTRELLAASLGKPNNNAIYARLSVLERNELVGKRFDKSYKLAGRPAEYYLTPGGLRALRQHVELDGLDDRAIKNSYNDYKISEPWLQRYVSTYKLANRLTSQHAELEFFTKRELVAFGYFPKRLPDGFISFRQDGVIKRYFLELFMSDEPPFATDGRIQRLITYYEDGDWDVTGLPFPRVLCVAETGTIERRLTKQISSRLNRSDTDMQFYVTSLKALLNATKLDAVWSDAGDPDDLRNLEEI